MHNTGMSEFNIDRLVNPDGGDYLATRKIVRAALETEHVTHLRREVHGVGRTVAMRRWDNVPGAEYVQYVLDFELSNSNEHLDGFQTKSLDEAVDWVIEFLNQGQHAYEAGDCLREWSNQANRDATVIAVIDDEIMIEVEMPGTTAQYGFNRRTGRYYHEAQPSSFLIKYNVRLGHRRTGKNYSYNAVPKKWLVAIDSQYGEWIGQGQRMPAGKPLALADALAK